MASLQKGRQISVTQKMLISLVTIGPGVINSLVVNALLIYYTDKLGMQNLFLYGIAILIYGIWNAINNPIVGVYIEQWNPPEGKEKLKTLMKRGLPIMFVGFLFFILPPSRKSRLVAFYNGAWGLNNLRIGQSYCGSRGTHFLRYDRYRAGFEKQFSYDYEAS